MNLKILRAFQDILRTLKFLNPKPTPNLRALRILRAFQDILRILRAA